MTEDRYDLKRLVHKSEVYSDYFAVDWETAKEVHIRRFFDQAADGAQRRWLEMFTRLGNQLTSLENAHITRVLESGSDEDGPFFIIEAHNLEIITDIFPEGMDNTSFEAMVTQVLEGLSYLHGKKLQHAAVSPHSVKVDQSRGSNHYKIDDIGLQFASSLMSYEAYSLDDYTFMAPEMFENHATPFLSDIYMFGQLFFYNGAGGHPLAELPWQECQAKHQEGGFMNLNEANSQISPEWAEWLKPLVAVNPQERPTVSEALASMPRGL